MQTEPQVVDFGPYHVIGMNYVGTETAEMKALWGSFIVRMGEITPLPGDPIIVGLCRCVAGATGGSFEYIAGVAANPGTPVPEGMMEASIGASKYAVFEVSGLNEIGPGWDAAMAWINAQTQWQGYCDGAEPECSCVNHPSFELYPPEFHESGKLYIYMPIKPKA